MTSQRDGPMADWLNTWDRSSTSGDNPGGGRMSLTNMNSDKELSDLLDFSAMFTPPAGTNATSSVGLSSRANPDSSAPPNTRTAGIDETWTTYDNRPFDGPSTGALFGGDDSDIISRKSSAHFSPSHPKSKDPFSSMLFQGPQHGPTSQYSSVSNDIGLAGTDWRRYKAEPKNGTASIRSVTSPTSDEIIPSDPSLQYPSPKGAIYAAPDYYMDHGSPDPWGNHITSSRPPVSIAPSGYAIHTEMPYPGIPPEGVDSRLAVAGASGLPPMSSFRQHGAAPSPPVNTTAQFVHPSPSVNGSNNNTGTVPATAPPAGQGTQPAQQPPNTAQTADALGKALASMYSTDAHSSTSYSSNPATPVASPPPLISDRTNPAPSSTASTGQPASGTTPAPSSAGVSSEAAIGTWTTAGAAGPPPSGVPYDNLHNLNRMQETLEDAIWVLKSHAESTQPNPAHIAMGGFPPASYPQALTDQLQNAPIDGSHTSQAIENATNILSAATSAFGASGNHPQSLTPATDPPPKGTKRAGESKGKKRVKSEAMDKDEFMDDMNDQDQYDEGMSELSGPDKQGRESERRHANNARERVRVRDINLAFKELGRMCAIHLKNDGPQTKIPRGNVAAVSPSSNNDGPPTKLTTLHQAVTIITSLESQVRERNLNPKAACLKRRGEEEKMNEDPNDRSRMGMNISGDKNRGAQQPRRGFENPLDNSGGLDPGIFSH